MSKRERGESLEDKGEIKEMFLFSVLVCPGTRGPQASPPTGLKRKHSHHCVACVHTQVSVNMSIYLVLTDTILRFQKSPLESVERAYTT